MVAWNLINEDSPETKALNEAAALYGYNGHADVKNIVKIVKESIPGGETDLSEEGTKFLNGSAKGCTLASDETIYGGQWQIDSRFDSSKKASSDELIAIGEAIEKELPTFTNSLVKNDELKLSDESGRAITLTIVGESKYQVLALSDCNFS